MPLRRNNTRTFHKNLFAGQMETILLFKRNDDLKQGTVTTYKIFNCRRSQITKTEETLQGDMIADHRCTWHIPRSELDRVGIQYLSPLDRIKQIIEEEKDRWWQPESTTIITVKLFGNHIDLECLRVDPPVMIPGDLGYVG